MRTAIYARISDDRQDGAGVDRQLIDCRSLSNRHGWESPREFVDNSVSAFSGKPRDAYLAMLEAIKAGDIDKVVVYHVDRLYRQPRELEDLISLADQGAVQIVSCSSGPLDLSTSDGRLGARVLIAVAVKESEDKARRVRRQKQQAREQGRPTGGYRAFGWQDGMTPKPDEATLINQAIDALLGGASCAGIARKWNAVGVIRPQGGKTPLVGDDVRIVVTNPRHAGLIAHKAEVIGIATWPAIVERGKWERVCALVKLHGAAEYAPRRSSLLTGLVVCGGCGHTMIRTNAHQGRKVWRCHSRGGCGNVSIDGAGLEAFLTEATLERADSAALAKVVRANGREGKQAAGIVAQLTELEQRSDAASASYSAGKLPIRAFEHAIAAITREQTALTARLGRLTATQPLAPYIGKKGVLRAAWPELDEDRRRAIIGAALGRISVAPVTKRSRSFDPSRVTILPPGTEQ
jgi:DNA invertase Pin-like site-specific DNA recombinase